MLAKIKDYMIEIFTILTKKMAIFVAIKQLLDHKQTSAPVLDESDRLIGIFSEKDCIKAVLAASYNQGNSGNVAEFMSTETNSVNADSSIIDIAEKFNTCSEKILPVLKANQVVGLVTGANLLEALISIK